MCICVKTLVWKLHHRKPGSILLQSLAWVYCLHLCMAFLVLFINLFMALLDIFIKKQFSDVYKIIAVNFLSFKDIFYVNAILN